MEAEFRERPARTIAEAGDRIEKLTGIRRGHSQVRRFVRNATPITLVLDNARYQRCKLVESLAQEWNIELLFLPSYSPNLNLIERLWKFVKKTALNSRHHTNFAEFQPRIDDCLNNLSTTHREKLTTLLTLKFQTFENVEVMAAYRPGFRLQRTARCGEGSHPVGKNAGEWRVGRGWLVCTSVLNETFLPASLYQLFTHHHFVGLLLRFFSPAALTSNLTTSKMCHCPPRAV